MANLIGNSAQDGDDAAQLAKGVFEAQHDICPKKDPSPQKFIYFF